MIMQLLAEMQKHVSKLPNILLKCCKIRKILLDRIISFNMR